MNEIEKAAQEKYPVNHDLPIMSKIGLNYSAHQGFIEGAEWQQEQNLLMHEKQKDKLVFESLRKTYEKKREFCNCLRRLATLRISMLPRTQRQIN